MGAPDPVRVLVVDDSAVVRRLLVRVIEQDPRFAPPATAANGRLAPAEIERSRPDIVVLDIEMPELDGLATLELIRRDHPRLPVVMFSTLTESGATATLQALSRGASDYVTKPSGTGSVDASMGRIREELLPKLLALTGGRHAVPSRRAAASATPTAGADPSGAAAAAPATAAAGVAERRARRRANRPEIVAIGTSTGGPNALADVLGALGAVDVPVVITQHIPPVFSAMLAQRLDTISPMPVREAADGDVLAPGTVWIAPGDRHLLLRRHAAGVAIELGDGPPENSCRPSVDVMFRSVAEVYGGAVLAVVLTGMGSDGLRGAEQLRALGATVIVQDQASSVVWGMPGAVASAGLADAVVPLTDVAAEIRRRLGVLAHAGVPASAPSPPSTPRPAPGRP